ncbi:TRAFAC clade GTPase domain-containing protein [Ralstonia pseudosolanacearum]
MEQLHLVLGMPSSGKSTFIAALGEVLLSNDVESSYKAEILDGAQGHMIALHERWQACEVLERTKGSQEEWISFRLVARGGDRALVRLPDLSGESIRDAVIAGLYPHELYDALAACGGVLLFTNTNAKFDDVLLSDVAELLTEEPVAKAAMPIPQEPIEASGLALRESNDVLARPFLAQDMPEQSKVVQLLQTITDFRPVRRRRIAIMLSAWDNVAQPTTPDEWLYENRAMLSQYLEHNDSSWEARVYGVSAQGGSLPQDKAKLQRIVKPSERVRIVGHGASVHDLCAPLTWLMQNQSEPR